jgi:hypothetical protein
MRVLVCGGRNYFNKEKLFEVLDWCHFKSGGYIECIIHGNATGADTLAGEWGKTRNVQVLAFPAEWDLYGSRAGHLRNAQMIREGKPEYVIAFPGGRGTSNMISQAEMNNIPVGRVTE